MTHAEGRRHRLARWKTWERPRFHAFLTTCRFDAALDTKLELIHVRHEAATVHMADAWGRLSGEPGVAMVTGGPGHANAVGALYTALANESPMVLLSGHAATDELGRGGFQEIAQADLARPVAKASWTSTSARTSAMMSPKAFEIAPRAAGSRAPEPASVLLERRRGLGCHSATV